MKKAWLLLLGIASLVALAFYFWRADRTPLTAPPSDIVENPNPTDPSNVDTGTEKRVPASTPSPQEQYRKALVEEDEMKRTPTWEEMRKEAPAEF